MPGPNKKFDVTEALEAAIHVFWRCGYQAASMSELMEAMGISKKSLYDTFGNKRDLFIRALKHYATKQNTELRQELSKGPSPLENLVNLFKKWQKTGGKTEKFRMFVGHQHRGF